MFLGDTLYQAIKEDSIQGRYLPPELLDTYLQSLKEPAEIESIGKSVEGRDVFYVRLGKGPINILLWSQMHGNETTTTKALLDFFNYVVHENGDLLKEITLHAIPMLNPDGSKEYTRENANGVDLNRDFQKLSQPESKLLKELFEKVKPDFCFNLHDQRTIYNVGKSDQPATLSFLAPAMDEAKSIPDHRKQAMLLVASIADSISKDLPGQIGRYSDDFNINCVGDTFMALGTPTILIEAGHYQNDYLREKTRFFVFTTLMYAVKSIVENGLNNYDLDDYWSIPENGKQFVDILIKNVHLLNAALPNGDFAAVQFSEYLSKGKVHFKPELLTWDSETPCFGHLTLDLQIESHRKKLNEFPEILNLIS